MPNSKHIIPDHCIIVGQGTELEPLERYRLICNFAGIGIHSTLLTEEEYPVVREIIRRMFIETGESEITTIMDISQIHSPAAMQFLEIEKQISQHLRAGTLTEQLENRAHIEMEFLVTQISPEELDRIQNEILERQESIKITPKFREKLMRRSTDAC